MRSAIRWAGNKVLDILFGRPEDIDPEYADYCARVRVECPCGCGMTMGEVKELGL